MTGVRQVQVTFDCEYPLAVAQFWKAALGYVDPPAPDGYASWEDYVETRAEAEKVEFWACQDPNGVGPRLYFQQVPEHKSVKNRLYLMAADGEDESCLVMQDVEGNEFCLD